MPFLMSFGLEPEIVTLAWIDNASVQFPLNIYATKGVTSGNPGGFSVLKGFVLLHFYFVGDINHGVLN
jgi:hypothetical protein